MPKVIVIHYINKLPTQLTPETVKGLKEAMERFLRENPDVKYHGTLWNPKTGVGVCYWEGPKEKIENFLKSAMIPYDEVVEVEELKL